MKRFLFPEEGRFFKANLHSHTTVSDGTLTPAEMKELYKANGYSILACTDHEKMVPHHDLTDPDFLMITGFEMGFDERWHGDFLDARCCDINLLALDPGMTEQPEHIREYNAACINDAIRLCREKGFFVTYNHPHWSQEHFGEYLGYAGMNAMEICNYSSLVDGYDEYNADLYHNYLKRGDRLYVIGTDDNHNRRTPGTRMYDSFGAFTMIKAASLDYASVARALLAGHFYASQGPEIRSLWIEDGFLHVECSPADRVIVTVPRRRCMSRYDEETGLISHASFDMKKEDGWFRVTVIDKAGLKADTNAYYTDEVLE
ncbi:MAG: PHP domain-containing protein [Clostridia bacterium]|nr:PHP domain-containing protein [Clostridia bacterium]